MELRIRPVRRWSTSRNPACWLLAAVLGLAAGTSNAAAGEPTATEPNVLEARSEVAKMADQAVQTLKSQLAMVGVAGWAVFSGDPLTARYQRGLGEAKSIEGETWFMRMRAPVCVPHGYRQVLVFRDSDAFREFHQGELQGKALEKLHTGTPQATVVAFKFRPAGKGESVQLQKVDLGNCRFALHKDLQRALVAPPSSNKSMGGPTHAGSQPGEEPGAGVSPGKRARDQGP